MEKEHYIIMMELLNMQEILLMILLMEKENINIKMVNVIQENGKIIYGMEKDYYIIKMEKLNMKVILLIINMKAKEN